MDSALENTESIDGEGFNRRQALQRLAVGGTIVWATPLISGITTAAAAASLCVAQTLDWDNFTTGSTFSSTVLGGVTVTISSTFVGTTPKAGNFTVVDSPHGGITGKSLFLEQNPVANTPGPPPANTAGAGGQTVTISFSQAVKAVSFTITDIDNLDGNWSDRFTLVTTPNSVVKGTAVIGVGATGNGTGGTTANIASGNGGTNVNSGAYRNSVDSNNLPNTDGAGNLTFTYNGPLTTVSFRYWCGGVGGGTNQLIRLGDIAFNPCP